MFGRRAIALLVAEFISAALLSIVFLSMIGRTSFPLFTAIAAGSTLAAVVYFFGSHGNPAVTVGLWTIRKVRTVPAVLSIAMQMLGGFAAWQLSEYLLDSQLQNLAGKNFDWRVMLAESLGGFVLGLGVAVAVTRFVDEGKQAVAEGVSLFMAILVATLVANGLINPAVALGVQSWSWAYVLGPVLGVVIGAGFYTILFTEPVKIVATASKRATAKKTVAKRAASKKKK